MIPTSTSVDPKELDLASPRLHAEHDLRPVWRRLRAERPVFWQEPRGEQPGFWVLTRYADLVDAYRDPQRFASGRGNMLSSLLHGGDSGGGRMLPVTDDPRHHEIRAVMTPAFAREALQALGTAAQRGAKRLVLAATAKDAVDFVAEVAAHVPHTAICDLLAVDRRDRADILRLTAVALAGESEESSRGDVLLARNELLLLFASLAKRRRSAPSEDLLGLLARDTGLGEDDVILNCYALLLGGDETARLAIAGAVQLFAEQPPLWRRFAGGEVSLSDMVEEVLRWTTPALHVGRTATEDVVLHGQRIRAGDIVTLWTCSANQDEREFDAPERFEPSRRPNRHLTFGYGTHFCIGAQLSRLEIGVVLRTLRELVAEIVPAGEPQPVYSNFLSGPRMLPVTLLRR